MEHDFLNINRESWNRRTQLHLESDFYDLKGFRAGKNSLMEPELNILPYLPGKDLLHLQCHFGQDSLSLARMGARVTGVDLSDVAINNAIRLAEELSPETRFICSDLYSLPKIHDDRYDIVFSSYGTIGWLPDLDRWASVIQHFLRPGGKFVFAEFHPFIWMWNNDLTAIAYDYFTADAIVENLQGTYAAPTSEQQFPSITWNHGIAQVVQSLISSGLTITHFREFDYSPYRIFPDMSEEEPGRFRSRLFPVRVPMLYTLMAELIE
jgi:SAM-dependent methyltransferase